MRANIEAIIDGQAGSCGKGKVIGQFAINNHAEVAIANCMPNAGHTFSHRGKKRVFRHIPVSAVNGDTQLFIGAGTVIDLEVLKQEYEENSDILEGRDIIVHPQVALIEDRHKERERRELRSGSTFKGCGAVLAEKAMRDPKLKFFKGFENLRVADNYHELLHLALEYADYAILEGAQGVDLDIDHSGNWPNVTSRQVSVARMCADSGISPRRINTITMVIRPFPIRIANETELGIDCYSGNLGTAEELSWERVTVAAENGWYPTMVTPEDIEAYKATLKLDNEYTTVTKKLRRVFDLDIKNLKEQMERNTPDNLYLNFIEYLDAGLLDATGDPFLNRYVREYLNYLETTLGININYLGTGESLNSFLTRGEECVRIRGRS